MDALRDALFLRVRPSRSIPHVSTAHYCGLVLRTRSSIPQVGTAHNCGFVLHHGSTKTKLSTTHTVPVPDIA
eukprot:3940481-Rhodomonas_salina.5